MLSEVSETHSKWYELAEKNLDDGDEIQKSYPCKFNGGSGYLLMSNRKLQFVHEEGFLRKTYELVLDLTYEKIGKISHEGRYELDLTDIEGNKHIFKTLELSVSIVEKSLKEIMASSHA